MAFLPAPFRKRSIARQIDGVLAEATAATPVPAQPQPAGRTTVRKVVVKKYGTFGAFLRPVGIAVGIVIVGVPAIWGTNIFLASEARRALHDTPVVEGKSTVTTPVRREVADNEVEFVVRNVDGRLVRVIAGKDATAQFINATLVSLDKQKARIHDRAAAELDQVFTQAYATRDADINQYADWFFAWGQSWRLMYEASAGAVQEAFRLGFSQTQVTDAARHGVEDYLLRHYQEFVLKPAQRDPFITAGVQSVFADANSEFRVVLASLDDSVQAFIRDKAVFTEPLQADAVDVKIDWDSQKWRAPRSAAEDHYLDPLRTVALGAGGALVLGPIIEKVALPLLARTTASVLASTRTVVGGAAVGSVEPGLGTAIGAIAGIALDWGINYVQGGLQRGDFIKENGAALDATIAAWKGTITPEVNKAIDAWFDDLSVLVVEQGKSAGPQGVAGQAAWDRPSGGFPVARVPSGMKIDIASHRVAEGEEIDLAKRATRIPSPYASKDEYQVILSRQLERLAKLHDTLYAAETHALLVTLQGMDTAGKDGIIKHVMTGLNPQGCHVHSFKQPSEEELRHDFLWRAWKVLPERGEVAVFNRSYYEELLIVRVHPELLAAEAVPPGDVGKKFWKARYRAIVEAERHLHHAGTRVVKLFLHISKDEQRDRLLARIDVPSKNWKFQTGDIAERERWDDYMSAYGHALSNTSTDDAPWFVIPADDKETARLIAAEIVVQALEGMDLRLPEVTPERERELQEIRRGLAGTGPRPKPPSKSRRSDA